MENFCPKSGVQPGGAGFFRTLVSAPRAAGGRSCLFQACSPARSPSPGSQPLVIFAERCNFMPAHRNWRDASQSLLPRPPPLPLEQF